MTEKNGSKRNHITLDSDDLTHLPRTDADKGREPELLSSHLGTRRYSISALVERIVLTFNTEHGEESPAYQEAVTHNQRLKLLRDTVVSLWTELEANTFSGLSLEEKQELWDLLLRVRHNLRQGTKSSGC